MTTNTGSLPTGFSVEKTTEAVEALIKYVKTSAADKKTDLLADYVDEEQKLPLESFDAVISTKKIARAEKDLKPCVVPLKHSIAPEDSRETLSICIFTKDPAEDYEKLLVEPTKTVEDCLAALETEAKTLGLSKPKSKTRSSKKSSQSTAQDPSDYADPEDTIAYTLEKTGLPELKDLASFIKIDRIVSESQLRAEYKPFQARRKLISEHDLFFAQDTVFEKLPALLGKSFYKSSKTTPRVIALSRRTAAQVEEQKKLKLQALSKETASSSSTSIAEAEPVSLIKTLQQIYACINGTSYIAVSGTTINVRVGSTKLSAAENAENVISVVSDIISQQKVASSWASIRSIQLKTPSGPALSVYVDSIPYENEKTDVVNEEELAALKKKAAEEAKAEKKRKAEDNAHIDKLLEEVVNKEDLDAYKKRSEEFIKSAKESKKAKLSAAVSKEDEE